jgi:hypothetical protein
MGKHKADKLSQTSGRQHNKIGHAPQNPSMGTEQHNQYR